MPSSSVVLTNATVVHHDRTERRDLAFVDGRVSTMLPSDAVRIDLAGHYVYPGLINAHDHLQLNCFPRLAHTEPFADSYEWIKAFDDELETSEFTALRAIPAACRCWQGAYKNLFCGVTSVAHHDPIPAELQNFPVLPLELGWSHSLALGGGRYGPEVEASFHASPATRPWVIHLAEGTSTRARIEFAELVAAGCLTERTVIVHGVGLSECDSEAIIARGAAVVWCPASNLELLGCTLEPRRLFDAHALSLGTDSRLTGSADLLDELRVASAHSDLEPREVLRLVTEDPSRTFRIPDHGNLHAGAVADCLILRADGDPYETLLQSTRAECRAVVRDGALCVGDPDFEPYFEDAVVLNVDGMPKLLSRHAFRADAIELEPGIELACDVQVSA